MKIGVFESSVPCETCGGHKLLWSPRHNATLEQDLIEHFESPLRWWEVSKKRRHAQFAAQVKTVCEGLREKTLHV